MGMPMSLEEDVRELKERVAYLDGWREGEANRYARLEADLAQVKEELHRLGDKIAAQDERLSGRIDRMMWFMLATLGGVLTNLVLTVLK